MAVITQTFPNSGSFAIPSNAINITYAIRGAKGGLALGSRDYWDGSVNNSCGVDYSSGSGNPAVANIGQQGQWLTGSFKTNMAGKTISFQKGLKGTNNFYVLGGAQDNGALGGAGYHNGGPGGVAPSSDSTGTYTCTRSGGPGGGGSSAFKYGSIILLEAGGGGAGGGAGNPGGVNASYVTSVTTNINLGSDGGQGGMGSTAHNAGSGGGGGGCPGGAGGWNNPSGNQGSGYPGEGGGGYYNTTYVDSCSAKGRGAFAGDLTDDGYAEISYEEASKPTVSITATNSSGTPITSIYKSQSVTITYSATGVGITTNTFTATNAAGTPSYPITTPGNSGVYPFAPVTTTTYTYTATNATGTSTASVIVTVIDDTPTITLVSNRVGNTINRGQNITLTWGASAVALGVTSTTMTGVVTPGVSGSITITPSSSGTATYTFTATNASGTATISLVVTTILLLPTASLTSSDSDNVIIAGDVQSGDPTTLTWSAGGYDITGYSMTGVTNPGSSGSTSVSPNITKTYTYTVTNATGSVSATKTITVYYRPVITRFDAPVSSIAPGQGLALTWRTSGDASSIQWVNGTPTPTVYGINSSVLVYPPNSTQYCIVAVGNGGVSETVCFDVNVVPIDTSQTDYDATFTNDGSVYIPPYGIDVTIDLAAASGGKGGTDAGGSGGGGGSGRRALFYFPDYVERTFTLRLGNQGSNGFGCVAGSGAGGGGTSNFAGGGNGGNSGPSGCSGGGGGGGGASGVYDSVRNGWVIAVGGGGGGGGASWNRSATSGTAGKGMGNGSLSSILSGDGGDSCPTDGGGGGGGGGGAGARPRGNGGLYGLDNNRGGIGGTGGGSSYDNSYCSFNYNTGTANFGDGFARVRYDIGPPDITSFTATPSTIIRGAPVLLEWTSLFSLAGSIDEGVGAIAVPNGNVTVYPQDDLEYILTVIGPGGLTDSAGTGNIVVYIPPVLIIDVSPVSIILNNSAIVDWRITGDGDTLYWTAGGIANTNLESNETVSPSVTTTYSGYVTGLGGTSPVASATLIVYYPPTLILSYPASLDYGVQGIIEYEGDYANTSVTLSATYNYDYVPDTTDDIVNLNTASSAEFGPNSSYSGDYDTTIVYNDRGPLSVTYTIIASGNGGSETRIFTIPINVDKTPDNLDIIETDEKLKDQDPVYTPETEILSEMYYIDDIDIKVEIKANNPILVDVDKNDDWQKIRQIGTPPAVQGNSLGGNSMPPEMPSEPGVYHIRPTSIPDEAPLIVKTDSITAIQAAKLITCVSVIDETDSSAYNNLGLLNAVWNQNPPVIGGSSTNRRGFRRAFPYRTFYLLDPGNTSGIDIPSAFPGDANAFGPIRVNRDEGNVGNRSDWFTICNFGSLPYGTIVSIWIDISGSMDLDTVRASYNYFLARCASAGIEIVLTLSDTGERYIDGHIVYLPPSANFTATDALGNTTNIKIISGDSVTLSWIVFGDVSTLSITPGVLNITPSFSDFVDTKVVSPTTTTDYLLTATGPAGTTTREITITVLIPPTITLGATSNPIIAGQCTYIDWIVNGDGTSIAWTKGSLTNTNIESNEEACPDDTTTYCGVASGPGGVSPETCITITVHQIPTSSLDVPAQTDYGVDFSIDYETQYANVSISLTPTYYYLDGSSTTGTIITRTPSTSAEIDGGASGTVNDTIANGTIPIVVPWNNFGPYSVGFAFNVVGDGGPVDIVETVNVVIDQTPVNLNIEETEDKLKDQDPVYTPDITPDTVIESDLYFIDDIDIPVEIKADNPIQVDINKQNDWKDLRQI